MRVEQVRGGVVEAVHEVHVAVVDSTGSLVARTGDPELVTFWRSAAKPFQALPLVEDGAAARFGLTSEELALAPARTPAPVKRRMPPSAWRTPGPLLPPPLHQEEPLVNLLRSLPVFFRSPTTS